jgi:hypothetical protein
MEISDVLPFQELNWVSMLDNLKINKRRRRRIPNLTQNQKRNFCVCRINYKTTTDGLRRIIAGNASDGTFHQPFHFVLNRK